jgi:hypothetical protein
MFKHGRDEWHEVPLLEGYGEDTVNSKQRRKRYGITCVEEKKAQLDDAFRLRRYGRRVVRPAVAGKTRKIEIKS